MRLFGVNIPDEKKVSIALTSVHGIGLTVAGRILKEAKIDEGKRTKDLSQDELSQIKQIVERDFRIEGELRQDVRQHIARLKNIKSYRGTRHAKHLPMRGQRTKRNARTVPSGIGAMNRGRKTMGSGRRKLTLK
ncbi:MAG: 30S ribosomal protein S13 [bacterium]|nr:30S ribosomal protein S13 [bacterium]MDZ4231402.1 30S ribosomal protein S13 [Patescibacteria group bacterium]